MIRGGNQRREKARRGNVFVELAAGITVMATFLTGTWEFGRSFFIYNRLQTVVRDGARYAATAVYDSPDGVAFHTRVKNMVVYGNPNAAAGAAPLVPDLTTAMVSVTEEKAGVMPTRITVRVVNYTLNNLFVRYTFTNKPLCRFNYTGQLITP